MIDTRPARGFERLEDKCGGRVTIRGTRIEPRQVRGRVDAGDLLAEIIAEHPDIPRADLEACLTTEDSVLDRLPLE